jgi:hypothetical protein
MRYEQGGVLFDLDGFPQGYSGNKEAAPAVSNPRKRVLTPPTVQSTRITDSDEGKGDDEGDDEDLADEGKKPAEEELDLIAWSRGEKKYPFFKVRAAIKAIIPEADTTSADSIVAAMREHGYLKD